MLCLLPSPRSTSRFLPSFFLVVLATYLYLDGPSNTLPAIFRPPPENALDSYEPYVSPVTADLIENYTIPAIKATLQELITLGMLLRPTTQMRHPFLLHTRPRSRISRPNN
jgi:hypothetical protein